MQRTQLELYGLFQTGIAPQQQDFRDLIDTVFAGDAATMQTAQAAVATANAAANAVAASGVAHAYASFTFNGRTWTAANAVGCAVTINLYTMTVRFTVAMSNVSYIVLLMGSGSVSNKTVNGFTYSISLGADNGFVVFGS